MKDYVGIKFKCKECGASLKHLVNKGWSKEDLDLSSVPFILGKFIEDDVTICSCGCIHKFRINDELNCIEVYVI